MQHYIKIKANTVRMQTICNEDIHFFYGYFWKTNADCSIEQVQECIHTDTVFNYVENCKTEYKTCISFFHYNDNKITKASAKYKWYKQVSEPNRH